MQFQIQHQSYSFTLFDMLFCAQHWSFIAHLILLFNPKSGKEIKLHYPENILPTKNDASIQ